MQQQVSALVQELELLEQASLMPRLFCGASPSGASLRARHNAGANGHEGWGSDLYNTNGIYRPCSAQQLAMVLEVVGEVMAVTREVTRE